jgi:hypothetical protein
VRGFGIVVVLFLASLVPSYLWPQHELWFVGGAIFIAVGIERAYLAWYELGHCA